MMRMWMVRSEGGSLFDTFRERGLVAIGFNQISTHARPGVSRQQLIDLYQQIEPLAKRGTAVARASQVWRFVNDIRNGDWIVTYAPDNRVYAIGKVTSDVQHRPDWMDQGMSLIRSVQWQADVLSRDVLSTSTKSNLGSISTIFEISQPAAHELLAATRGRPAPAVEDEAQEEITDPLADIESHALERIKDRVNELDWDDMQQLVAGILRAMGYKTQVSPPGADRGKDIVASPDGFGFEHPRIVVEVKHRKGQMGSQEIRSFLGGRHKDDRGLYVSTGGFTKDAQYEADRASIPLAMWTLDHVVRALIEHYNATDAETKRIVPLKRLYWPA